MDNAQNTEYKDRNFFPRSLGYYFYYRQEYSTAVENLKKSLEHSSFQLGVLLRLGYASMQVEDWETAAQAYRRYCAYESDVSSPFNCDD